jgi:hypothetical protein
MKLDSLNNSVKEIQNKSASKKQPTDLEDMLSTMLGVIQRFEKNGNGTYKNTRDRIDILKNFVTDFIKDEEQKQIIMGGN